MASYASVGILHQPLWQQLAEAEKEVGLWATWKKPPAQWSDEEKVWVHFENLEKQLKTLPRLPEVKRLSDTLTTLIRRLKRNHKKKVNREYLTSQEEIKKERIKVRIKESMSRRIKK